MKYQNLTKTDLEKKEHWLLEVEKIDAALETAPQPKPLFLINMRIEAAEYAANAPKAAK